MSNFVWTGVGSRIVPTIIADYQAMVGGMMAELGGQLRTGDAFGSDENFLRGYNEAIFNMSYMPPAEVYYTRLANRRGLVHDPARGYFEAEQYESFEKAKRIAEKARGSFQNLKDWGIALHTRNVYQVLGTELDKRSWLCILYAEPAGKKGRVKGGTNTALQVAKRFNVPTVNIYTEEVRWALKRWLLDQLERKYSGKEKLRDPW